jgi:hypothetical protein
MTKRSAWPWSVLSAIKLPASASSTGAGAGSKGSAPTTESKPLSGAEAKFAGAHAVKIKASAGMMLKALLNIVGFSSRLSSIPISFYPFKESLFFNRFID